MVKLLLNQTTVVRRFSMLQNSLVYKHNTVLLAVEPLGSTRIDWVVLFWFNKLS